MTHFSHSLLLPALEWHKAARSSTARLTVKGGKHGARAISPSVGGGSEKRLQLEEWWCSEHIARRFIKCWCQRFGKYLHFCKKRLFKSIKTQNGHHGNSCVYASTAPVVMGKRTAAGQPLIFSEADIFRTYFTVTFSFLYTITRTILNVPIPCIFFGLN